MKKDDKMKKLMGLFISGVAVLALSGCTADSSTGGDDEISSVNVFYLEDGYQINGYNDAGQDVTFEYCGNRYDYYRGDNEAFHGRFNINENYTINMYDDSDDGSYIMDTDGYLRVNSFYDIYDIADQITIESIVEISC